MGRRDLHRVSAAEDCREFMVITPPENCKEPYSNPVKGPVLPLKFTEVLTRLSANLLGGEPAVIPIALALWWRDRTQYQQERAWNGPELIEAMRQVAQSILERDAVASNRETEKSPCS